MQKQIVAVTFSLLMGVCAPGVAAAQTSLKDLARVPPVESAQPPAGVEDPSAPRTLPARLLVPAQGSTNETKVAIYPVLLWMPSFTATTSVPPFPEVPGGPDLPGDSGSTSASFDGAVLAGFSVERTYWRIDVDGIWAALATQRDLPLLKVDLDLIYGHVSGGVKIYKDLYVTGGVRRVALKYDIQIGDRPEHFTRKPGIWDPLVGLAWHSDLGSRWTLHVIGEGGGFGVGADLDLLGSVRADWKMFKYVGLTFGYTALRLELSNTVLERTLEVKQTLHGPTLGLGLYF